VPARLYEEDEVTETTLILVRHGATPSNLMRPYVLQGQGVDHDLDPLGVRQAEAAAGVLGEFEIAAVYASPLKRAQQTALAIASRHSLRVETLPAIIEADVGRWEGMAWETLPEVWQSARQLHDEDPSIHGYPEGENFAQVRDRCVPAFESLAHRHAGQTVIAVGHNVVNRVCLAHWMGLPIRYCRRLPQNNAGYNVVMFRGSAVKVMTINASGHLSGLLPPD
jgi:broad specificity phosphatase PhoE